MNSGIYIITNAMTGSQYVGSAVNFNKRWATHIRDLKKGSHHSRYLQRAWDLYGEDAFEFDVILRCAPDRCIVHEQEEIDFFKPAYNMCQIAGSTLGKKHTPATKAKISAATAGKTRTAAARANIAAGHMGLTRTAAVRASMSNRMKGNTQWLGRTHTAAARAKISAAAKNRTPEHAAKLVASCKRTRAAAQRGITLHTQDDQGAS